MFFYKSKFAQVKNGHFKMSKIDLPRIEFEKNAKTQLVYINVREIENIFLKSPFTYVGYPYLRTYMARNT